MLYMNICQNCKTENDTDSKFCKNCGSEIVAEEKKSEKKNRLKKVGKIALKILVVLIALSAIVVAAFFAFKFIDKNNTYNDALDMAEAKQYDEAVELFKGLGDFRDSKEQIQETNYKKATDFLNNNQLEEAMEAF